MATGILQPDGTRCYSGPNCSRHGAYNQTQTGYTRTITTKSSSKLFGLKSPEKAKELKQFEADKRKQLTVLTEDEENDLRRYSYLGFLETNKYLRDPEGVINTIVAKAKAAHIPEDRIAKRIARKAIDIQETVEGMDKAIWKAPRSEKPRTLYRHRTIEEGTVPAYVRDNFKVGETVEEEAYMSTSLDPDLMLITARKGKKHLLVFEVISSSGAIVHDFDGHSSGSSVQDDEYEVVLPRGSKFTVESIRKQEFELSPDSPALKNSAYFQRIPEKATFTVVRLIHQD